eukprot:12105327-Karenia_brevis.AAC.1
MSGNGVFAAPQHACQARMDAADNQSGHSPVLSTTFLSANSQATIDMAGHGAPSESLATVDESSWTAFLQLGTRYRFPSPPGCQRETFEHIQAVITELCHDMPAAGRFAAAQVTHWFFGPDYLWFTAVMH